MCAMTSRICPIGDVNHKELLIFVNIHLTTLYILCTYSFISLAHSDPNSGSILFAKSNTHPPSEYYFISLFAQKQEFLSLVSHQS